VLDPKNRLLGHMPRRRIDAEELRDALLAVSGQLDRKIGGGELVEKVHQKADVIDKKRQLASASTLNSSWEGFNTPRRSIYLPVIRNGQADILTVFDTADANAVTSKRNETTVPAQTAFLLNNPFVHKLARHFAQGLREVRATDAERIRVAYRRSLGRLPSEQELAETEDFLKRYSSHRQASGHSAASARESAWQSFCHLLFCLNEFVYIE